MEAKNAFAILGDPKERAEYDRRLRMVSGCDLFYQPCYCPPCPVECQPAACQAYS
jgi:hypothetical protein